MSSPRPGIPQRPLPPEIYRRRRILALAALAVVVWLLTAAISGIAHLVNPGTANNAANPSASSSTAAADGACAPGAVTVTAHIGSAAAEDQNSFAAKVQPNLWWEITNTGTTACKFNYIGAATYFTITSGSETIWSSKDCAEFTTNAQDQTIDIPAGTSQVNQSLLPWQRTRSGASTGCLAQGNTAAAPGAYHLVATVSNIHSPDVQFLLN